MSDGPLTFAASSMARGRGAVPVAAGAAGAGRARTVGVVVVTGVARLRAGAGAAGAVAREVERDGRLERHVETVERRRKVGDDISVAVAVSAVAIAVAVAVAVTVARAAARATLAQARGEPGVRGAAAKDAADARDLEDAADSRRGAGRGRTFARSRHDDALVAGGVGVALHLGRPDRDRDVGIVTAGRIENGNLSERGDAQRCRCDHEGRDAGRDAHPVHLVASFEIMRSRLWSLEDAAGVEYMRRITRTG